MKLPASIAAIIARRRLERPDRTTGPYTPEQMARVARAILDDVDAHSGIPPLQPTEYLGEPAVVLGQGEYARGYLYAPPPGMDGGNGGGE